MKLNTVTRYIVALIDNIKHCRKHAVRRLRCFRAEFLFQRPSKRWAATHFKAYMQYKADVTPCVELLKEQFGKLIKPLTLKPRFNALEVAA